MRAFFQYLVFCLLPLLTVTQTNFAHASNASNTKFSDRTTVLNVADENLSPLQFSATSSLALEYPEAIVDFEEEEEDKGKKRFTPLFLGLSEISKAQKFGGVYIQKWNASDAHPERLISIRYHLLIRKIQV